MPFKTAASFFQRLPPWCFRNRKLCSLRFGCNKQIIIAAESCIFSGRTCDLNEHVVLWGRGGLFDFLPHRGMAMDSTSTEGSVHR
jgi:hypothetical protein